VARYQAHDRFKPSDRHPGFFVADAENGKAPHDLKGLPDVKIEWLAEDRLRVARHPQVRVFRTEVRKDRVAIQYELDSSILNHAPAEAAQ